MGTHKNLTKGLFLLFIMFLAGCGGGGNGHSEITGSHQDTTVVLGSDGDLTFPAGSLPAGASVTVTNVPYPRLTEDLLPVGSAWKVDLDLEPTAPVDVRLPVPDGEAGDQLILVRIEDSGRISLLQTRIDNGMLVARTPGFSTVLPARKTGLLSGFRTEITGPDFLPTHVTGQYFNPSLIFAPSVTHRWNVFENTPDMDSELFVDDKPLQDTTARLTAANPGSLTLMLEFSEPSTGLNAIAMKDVSVQESLEAGSSLEIAVDTPLIVHGDELFDVSAVVLNTDIQDMDRWEWSLGTQSGSCEAQCSIRLDLTGLHLASSVSKGELTVSGVAANGSSGTVTREINVLDNSPRIVRLERTSNENALIWDETANPNPTATFMAEIQGGVPPYSYRWHYYEPGPVEVNETHVSYEISDTYTRTFDQPGHYFVYFDVIDSLNQEHSRNIDVQVSGVLPMSYGYANTPATDVPIDQPVTIKLQAKDGVLIYGGVLQEGYPYVIDWGDGSDELGIIEADHPASGGEIDLEHTYTSADTYTIKAVVADALRTLDREEFDTITSNMPELVRTTEISVFSGAGALPDESMCPETLTLTTSGGGTVNLDFVSLTHPETDWSYCNYEIQGGSEIAVHLYAYYGEFANGGCGLAEPDDVLYVDFIHVARSVLRTVQSSWAFNPEILGYDSPAMNDEEAVLTGVVTYGVSIGLGQACPP